MTQPINQWIPMRCPYGRTIWEPKKHVVMCTIVYPHQKHRNGDTTWT